MTKSVELILPSDPAFERVLTLAKRHSSTLGFLPHSAFVDRAVGGRLLAVRGNEGQSVLGYVLYDLAKGRVRIIQLCVGDAARRGGLARLLLAEVSKRHREQRGLILKCRRDFAASQAWQKLGFIPIVDVPGRSADGKLLTVWWRSHGHADLFTELIADAPQLRAALDLNVFLDLYDRDRDGFEESSALLADWLPSHVKLVVTSQLQVELNNLQDSERRSRQRLALSTYDVLSPSYEAVDHLYNSLSSSLDDESLRRDPSLLDDARHVAAAAASGAQVFVTRDSSAISTLQTLAMDKLGVRILRPSEVLVHLDEISNSIAYRPADLLETGYVLSETGTGQEELIAETFLSKTAGEKKAAFLHTWREVTSAADVWRRQLILDPQGTPVALFVAGLRESEYVVRVIRVAGGALASTLLLQVLALLRRQACEIGSATVRIVDNFPSRGFQDCVVREGFLKAGENFVAPTANLILDADSLVAWALKSLPEPFPSLIHELRDELRDPFVASEFEHNWWPLKIADAALPTYIVPITPTWSYGLFGYPRGLLSRDEKLGLSREHVYYRSPRPQPIRSGPGRILWYVSGKGKDRVGAVIGCSRLLEVLEDEPSALYRLFRI